MLLGGMLGAPGDARGQAEEAPAGYEPPPGVPISVDPARVAAEREAMRRKWVLWISPRFVVGLGEGGAAGTERLGWGAGVGIGRALFVSGRTRFGLGASFGYERQQRERVPPARLANGDVTQSVSQASFSLDLRLDGLYLEGALRPWVTLGPAISVGSYSDPPSDGSPQGVSLVTVLGGLRAAAGLAYEIGHLCELGLRVETLATFAGPSVGVPAVHPLTPGNFSVGVDVGFRF